MNIYTVRKATQGLANYIKKQGGEEKGVAIAYDSRRMSPEFAIFRHRNLIQKFHNLICCILFFIPLCKQ